MTLYTPNNQPSGDSLADYHVWVLQELQALGMLLQKVKEQQIDEVFVAPAKPRMGMVVLADGTEWNPGSGRGCYCFDATTASWRFLG